MKISEHGLLQNKLAKHYISKLNIEAAVKWPHTIPINNPLKDHLTADEAQCLLPQQPGKVGQPQ